MDSEFVAATGPTKKKYSELSPEKQAIRCEQLSKIFDEKLGHLKLSHPNDLKEIKDILLSKDHIDVWQNDDDEDA